MPSSSSNNYKIPYTGKVNARRIIPVDSTEWSGDFVSPNSSTWMSAGDKAFFFGGSEDGEATDQDDTVSNYSLGRRRSSIASSCFGQSEAGSPQIGGYPASPQIGGYPASPQIGGYPASPQIGGYPASPQIGGHPGARLTPVYTGRLNPAISLDSHVSYERGQSRGSNPGYVGEPTPPNPNLGRQRESSTFSTSSYTSTDSSSSAASRSSTRAPSSSRTVRAPPSSTPPSPASSAPRSYYNPHQGIAPREIYNPDQFLSAPAAPDSRHRSSTPGLARVTEEGNVRSPSSRRARVSSVAASSSQPQIGHSRSTREIPPPVPQRPRADSLPPTHLTPREMYGVKRECPTGLSPRKRQQMMPATRRSDRIAETRATGAPQPNYRA